MLFLKIGISFLKIGILLFEKISFVFVFQSSFVCTFCINGGKVRKGKEAMEGREGGEAERGGQQGKVGKRGREGKGMNN